MFQRQHYCQRDAKEMQHCMGLTKLLSLYITVHLVEGLGRLNFAFQIFWKDL